MLANLGVCASYEEAVKFESLVTTHSRAGIYGGYVQFVFDNVVYNRHSIDGHGTFHVMGGIICVTPNSSLQADTLVSRLTSHHVSDVEICGLSPVQIYHRSDSAGYSKVTDMNVQALQFHATTAI
ncbi:hypothetical protein PR048_030366 [Dryococelus australis]|uniref:Uncharacterized protein n=1 Tax=Dryococelus australis TaxID=614101 RepID=A0ABQ9G8S9_9NEOP|nr:hypothetical protein PR048_030366 [Dryococelus australis]